MNPNSQPTRVESFYRSALAFFSNRRIRTRTYGGVGGAEPRGSPLSRSMAIVGSLNANVPGQLHRRDRTGWLGCQDSNLGMAESKCAALPLGYAPPKRLKHVCFRNIPV